ncbi:electron transfer flavoprotein [Intrasporangium oryzae NRRL B-24470]|uniref:Electron transfer flavoprotein n=1 Tax=Intrasporangium oryzae NRRL B-24470 TaxID=1386089 RepID=W9G169_9MICO|nr:electron transfer flavoprotein [Intrasporangium oryzae NRRL B-24470]
MEDARVVAWDELVLATGSTSFVPPIEGLDADHLLAGTVPGVVAFRTVDDCRRIVETATSAAHAVVLGGGLLGLEAARGLLARGVHVTVVHPQGHPMDRQLDADGGAVLTRVVRGLGARLVLGRFAVAHRPATPETSAEVVLDDGSTLAADLVVVAAGVRPRTDLAAHLGLEVNRAVVVDDQLRTSLPHIHAIGECAEHRGEVPGLVQPGWDQARVLADVLSGADPHATYAGTSVLTRLKAHDIDLASMGCVDIDVHDPDHEVLAFTDPSRGRYAKLVLRADRLVGAILLGVGDAAGALTQLYDTGAPAPRDRLVLMLGRAVTRAAAPESVSLAEMPGSAVICRCNTVTKSAIVAAHRDGADTVPDVAEATRATTGCGGCTSAVEGLCSWLRSTDPSPDPAQPSRRTTPETPAQTPVPALNAALNAALNEGAA